jgi:hypothetical protein
MVWVGQINDASTMITSNGKMTAFSQPRIFVLTPVVHVRWADDDDD